MAVLYLEFVAGGGARLRKSGTEALAVAETGAPAPNRRFCRFSPLRRPGDIIAALGLDGPAESGPDHATLQPSISAPSPPPECISLGTGRAGSNTFISMKSRWTGDGQGWCLFAIDMTPGYDDPTPLPAVLSRWKYRAIHRIADVRTGNWSAEASVALGGN